ncbi:hypothetical protein TanjilG_29660 [Lupinus angustifolius]|uniref:Uncharacterized protein n=1 Tax=Lupinus angustifolius TaxID=3871 RepID=A0A4P1R5Y7_LUPAN|nr:PREDICTED: uncharacterized protein LOC109361344 [Lupinus angustifolius]OIW02884.1 hypothetical protein TanjilG_29660 [Lupinus angustifolius]
MVCGQLITLLYATSRSSLVKPSSPFYNCIKNYGQAMNGNRGRWIEERAPSTAEEFQRIAEEKVKEAKQGVVAKTVGAQDGTIGETNIESAKNRFKPGTN